MRDTLKQVLDTYKGQVKVVFMQQPLPFHQNAMPAALASMAAHRQGKFWEMEEVLFANQKALDGESIKKYAKDVGLNLSKFEKDMADPALKAQIEAQSKAGQQVGARGTPAFFVNGKFLSGAQPFEAFKAKVDEEIKAADELVKKGIPVSKVYDTLMKDAKTEVAAAAPAPSPAAPGGGAEQQRALAPIPVGNSPYKGGKGAPVVIAEFSDFQ